jgi:hypothetical protein
LARQDRRLLVTGVECRAMRAPASDTAVLSTAAGSQPQGPQLWMGAGSSHFSTIKSEKKWQRLYPVKKEFTKICSEKYPTNVVRNYKSKENCFFITQTNNTISRENRMSAGF